MRDLFDLKMLRQFAFADLLLIFVHIVLAFGILFGLFASWPAFLNIQRDWSGAEILNYVKWLLIIGVFLASFARRRAPVFLGLAIFFLVALLDDSLQLHERGSDMLLTSFPMYDTFGERQSIAGEVIIWSLLGLVAGGGLLVGWLLSVPADRRRIIPVLFLFAGVVFFGLVVDVLHHLLFTAGTAVSGLFGIIEDGGESLMITLLVAYVWRGFARE